MFCVEQNRSRAIAKYFDGMFEHKERFHNATVFITGPIKVQTMFIFSALQMLDETCRVHGNLILVGVDGVEHVMIIEAWLLASLFIIKRRQVLVNQICSGTVFTQFDTFLQQISWNTAMRSEHILFRWSAWLSMVAVRAYARNFPLPTLILLQGDMEFATCFRLLITVQGPAFDRDGLRCLYIMNIMGH